MKPIPPKTRVRLNGREGVVVPTLPSHISCAGPDDVEVAFPGSAFRYSEAAPVASLAILGPEDAIPDGLRCGAGRGAQCCKFLIAGPDGIECGRHGHFRMMLLMKDDMTAKRTPDAAYPDCMLPTGG